MSWRKFTSCQFTSAFRSSILAAILSFCLFISYGCSIQDFSPQALPDFDLPILGDLNNDLDLKEVSPPELVESLKAKLTPANPKISILEPGNDELLDGDSVTVKLSVSGLKLFKDQELGLGPHIALVLDDHPPVEVFDLSQPTQFDDLQPGTHTLRAIAEYPWHESFKNAEAYAQVSFDVLTASHRNSAGSSPILTTSSISKIYTSEPMLLDFVVRNGRSQNRFSRAPSVKVSVNDDAFIVDSADSNIYLSGLKTGTNWIKLELQDANGHLSSAPFSEQLFKFEFRPEQSSSIGTIMADTVSLDAVSSIIGIAKPTPPAKLQPAASDSPVAPSPEKATRPAPASPAQQSSNSKAPSPTPPGDKKTASQDASSKTDPVPSKRTPMLTTDRALPSTTGATVEQKPVTSPKASAQINTSNTAQKTKESTPERRRSDITAPEPKSNLAKETSIPSKSEIPPPPGQRPEIKTPPAPKARPNAAPSSQTQTPQKPSTDFGAQMRSLKNEGKKQMTQTFDHWRDQFNRPQNGNIPNNPIETSALSSKTAEEGVPDLNPNPAALSTRQTSPLNGSETRAKLKPQDTEAKDPSIPETSSSVQSSLRGVS